MIFLSLPNEGSNSKNLQYVLQRSWSLTVNATNYHLACKDHRGEVSWVQVVDVVDVLSHGVQYL